VLGNLVLRFLLRSDIPSRADKTVDFAGSISYRKPMHRDPTDFAAGAHDPKSFIEVSCLRSFSKLCQHMNAVFGMDESFVRRRIFQQTLARTSGDRLISFGDVKGLFGLRVNHPEDFLNVVCHLLEPFFGVELYLLGAPQRSGVEDNQNGENSGPEKQEGGEYVERPKPGPEYC
jgi:hypothetical protein